MSDPERVLAAVAETGVPLTVADALDLLRAVVAEADRYTEGSPAQVTYLRTVLRDVAVEVIRAYDR